jgi:hypothetical protein
VLSDVIQNIVRQSYDTFGYVLKDLNDKGHRWGDEYETEKGGTLFTVYRSCFWDCTKSMLIKFQAEQKPENEERDRALGTLVQSKAKMDFTALLGALPFVHLPSYEKMTGVRAPRIDFTAEAAELCPFLGYEMNR